MGYHRNAAGAAIMHRCFIPGKLRSYVGQLTEDHETPVISC
jgi:hypothetical protein